MTRTQALTGRSKPAALEALETRTLYAAAAFDVGININANGAAVVSKAIPILKELGVDSVRIWVGVDDFNDRKLTNNLQRAIDYHNAGFDVMVIVSPENGTVPEADAVTGWFKWATGNSEIKNAVDRWEIGNEVDHPNYWKGTTAQYVNQLLKPAYQVLHPAGEQVISAGPSWDPQDVQDMINNGMLSYVDYVGFHPYANGVKLQKQRIAEVKAVVAGRKPLAATEWNIRGYESNKTAWTTAVEDAYAQVADNFAINYYFALLNTTATPAGPGGVMNADGTKTAFFYALQDAIKENGGEVALPPDVGNTPSGIPSVSKLSLYNADTDELITDSLTAGATIDIAAIGTRNLAFVATGSSGVSSIKFVVDGTNFIQNDAPYSAFGDQGVGQYDGKSFANGTHTLIVKGYSADNAAGTSGSTRSFTFNVVSSSVAPAPKVTGLTFVNAKTGQAISGLTNLTGNASVKLSSLAGNIAGVAISNSMAGSIKLTSRGKTVIENNVPYTYFGDANGTYTGWTPKKGSYTFTATAYSGDNATGTKGNTITITIKFY